MPITRSAIKKLRQDIKRQKTNNEVREAVRGAIKKFRKNKSEKFLREAYSLVDKARKKRIFHANKASRLKSQLAKMLKGKKKATADKKTKKK